MSDSLTPEVTLNVESGVNFNHTFQWLAGGLFMAPIEVIEVGYPTIVTVTDHGLNTVTPHPVFISGVQGCSGINSTNLKVPLCTYIDANTFSLPETSVGKDWVEGTGEITYLKPTPLTGYTGVCVIKKHWFSSTAIHTLTTENGGMVLGTVDGSIQLLIPKAITAGFTFRNAVYDVDLSTAGGYETRVFKGNVVNHREASP